MYRIAREFEFAQQLSCIFRTYESTRLYSGCALQDFAGPYKLNKLHALYRGIISLSSQLSYYWRLFKRCQSLQAGTTGHGKYNMVVNYGLAHVEFHTRKSSGFRPHPHRPTSSVTC